MLPRDIVLASHNPGKIAEFQRMLGPYGIQVHAPFGDAAEVAEEVGSTYYENARIKALAVATALGVTALADDSGVEVDALQGAPGLYSARFVSDDPWENSREILLRLMAVPPSARSARMVAALVVMGPDGQEIATSRGVVEGTILTWPRGRNGFGVDPIFSIDGRTSLAEWPEHEKDRHSHRGQAVAALVRDYGIGMAETP